MQIDMQRLPLNFLLLALGGSYLFTLSTPIAFGQSEPTRPDVVVIVADDLGWGDLGCYGSEDLRTPALDRMASEGQRWTNFYANCCVCSPTRAAILTGCYPDRVGVPGVIRTNATNSWGNLANDVQLLPELLQEVGYQTSCIGKWHLGLTPEDHPCNRGFDHFHGFLGDMMDDYFHHRRQNNNYMRRNFTEINPAGHATTLFTQWAQAAITEMTQNENPYFLYLAYNAPHTPIQPPEKALQQVRARLPDLPEQRAKLIALIEDMDQGIGRVLDTIRQTNRPTLTIFVSDNGGQLNVGADNGGLRDGKQSNYEGGLRVPAIFHWPDEIEPSTESHAIGATMDLLPTLCEILDLEDPKAVDGISLAPWLDEPSATQKERELYFVRREGGTRYAGLTIEALRLGPWKLVHNLPTQKFELFHLADDPLEQEDLSSKNPAKLRSLMNRLMVHIQAAGSVPWQ